MRNIAHDRNISVFLSRLAFLRKITQNGTSDADLVAAYRSTADLAVLGDLYSRYMDLVYGVCLKYLTSAEDAQDAVMAVFEELIPKLQKHEVDNFRSWLYTVAKNHCLMRLRTEKRTGTTKMSDEFVQSEESGHLEDVLQREENLEQLDDCLKQLATEQRRAIELFYLQGKCYNEIAAETGLEWAAVRSYIQNGRRNLKICMEGRTAKTTVK